ncbi:hypothetical protein M441DRAFT_316925 [Trichoderma asperellum CBS 433.97]|uniref:Uncharacterized protein n=1 Tax=Trichoderma asperellum (strain ATCC 204424 / CBS 433.97 / NBRC 101777) TaxID=1042311 RepID=A0A2T3ZKS4_TRIA4|nr:hypothetical protein M441DRAFT_316925 [Trichoderma asperellum CBS 433.97]PTB45418.1 hypothetical protein M441DRAFT_316925 [Trichoderma asperellum CBS 433.97]
MPSQFINTPGARPHSCTMQNSSTAAEIIPAEDSLWVVWQHPVSAIAFLTIIFSIVILAAAFVSNACLPVYLFDLKTLRFYPTRQKKRDRPRSSSVTQHQQLRDQLTLAET